MKKSLLVADRKEAEALAQTRSCGDCSACCVLPRIPELQKMGYLPCPYLNREAGTEGQPCGSGSGSGGGCCSVYTNRPQVCRDYECLWRMGRIAGDERRRPDQLGLMFGLDIVQGQAMVEAWELWEGAARDYPARGVLEAVASTTHLMIRWYGVPCSVEYRGPESFLLGENLSRAAREHPRALAAYLRKRALLGELEDPNPESSGLDVASLERGEPVVAWFNRSGRLALPVVAPGERPQPSPSPLNHD